MHFSVQEITCRNSILVKNLHFKGMTWPWKLGKGLQNTIIFYRHNNKIFKVWLESIVRLKRHCAETLFWSTFQMQHWTFQIKCRCNLKKDQSHQNLPKSFRSPNNVCNSYTMGFPPVRGDNPRALASGLSYVQVDKHGVIILYHLHQCRPCTARDISC